MPKNIRKSLYNSDNYGGIALSSVSGKMLEWVILNNYGHKLKSTDLQFAYKRHHSTVQCTFLASEIIQYYCNSRGNVYTLLLDGTKAFDRVECVKLGLLVQKGKCPLIVRALFHTSESVRVQLSSSLNHSFSLTNGVNQGDVFSPILFILYDDQQYCTTHTFDEMDI